MLENIKYPVPLPGIKPQFLYWDKVGKRKNSNPDGN
jgi:hypothetical protein